MFSVVGVVTLLRVFIDTAPNTTKNPPTSTLSWNLAGSVSRVTLELSMNEVVWMAELVGLGLIPVNGVRGVGMVDAGTRAALGMMRWLYRCVLAC
jgi:hypothetical protein